MDQQAGLALLVYFGRILAACVVIVLVLFAAWWVAWKLVLGNIPFFQEIFGAPKPPARTVKTRRSQPGPRRGTDQQARSVRSRHSSQISTSANSEQLSSSKALLNTEKGITTSDSDISPNSASEMPATARTIPVYDDYFARKDSPERPKRTFGNRVGAS